MKKSLSLLLGVFFVSLGISTCACDTTEVHNINEGISEDAPHYSMQSFNLALLEDCDISLHGTDSALDVQVVDRTTGVVTTHDISSFYRYIRSFDTYETMLDYTNSMGNTLDELSETFLLVNWDTDFYFEVE